MIWVCKSTDSGARISNLGAQIVDSVAGIYDLSAQITDSCTRIYDLGAQIQSLGGWRRRIHSLGYFFSRTLILGPSEGFPRTRLFHPWARWGKGPAGKSSVSSSRDRVGWGGLGCAHVILSPDKETSTRQGNKHPTRKQASDKETGTQQGNRHSTRKQDRKSVV